MVLIDEPPATFCANAHSRILLIAPLCARVRLSSYLRSAFHILHARPDVSQSNKDTSCAPAGHPPEAITWSRQSLTVGDIPLSDFPTYEHFH